ncbi:MAG TPA: DUF4142 domain-containing protein [Steroidobacteraceae bacterium]
MKALSTAAALTVLAATTAAFAAQTQDQPYPSSSVSARDSEIGANLDAVSCHSKGAKGSDTSTEFASTAAQDGTVEVALAGLALRKSSNDQVRQFAERMMQDYARSNSRLDLIVKCEGLVLPTKLDAKHNAAIEKLDAASGSAFDTAYLRHTGEKHSRSVALFESASRSGDPDVAAFARSSLAMLQEHQELADNLRGALGPTTVASRR